MFTWMATIFIIRSEERPVGFKRNLPFNEFCRCRTAVVCPIIDVIGDNDFGYLTGSDMTWVCSFNEEFDQMNFSLFRVDSIGA